VHLQPRSITASQCNSKPAPLRPPCLHDHDLPVHIHPCLIAGSKFAQSWPPSASPNSLDYALQVSTIMASNCISPNSLNHGLQVHPQTRSITVFKCISQSARSRLRNVSPNPLDIGFRVYLLVHSIVIFRPTSNYSQAPPAPSPDIPCVHG